MFNGGRRAQDFLVLPQQFMSFPSVFFVDEKADGGWILFYLRLVLLWVIGVGFKNTSTLSVKWNVTRIVSKLFGWVYIILSFPSLLVELQVPNFGDFQAACSMRDQFLIPAL